ncbi:MAG TPA: hypothetical protein VMW38_21885, partial [Terriglobia bacterium]|nr:hypothetical protein [Terriglobia bacterium]
MKPHRPEELRNQPLFSSDHNLLIPIHDPKIGASVIQCCYAAIEKRKSSLLTKKTESKNTHVTFRTTRLWITEEKISLNVSRLLVNPPCMAG